MGRNNAGEVPEGCHGNMGMGNNSGRFFSFFLGSFPDSGGGIFFRRQGRQRQRWIEFSCRGIHRGYLPFLLWGRRRWWWRNGNEIPQAGKVGKGGKFGRLLRKQPGQSACFPEDADAAVGFEREIVRFSVPPCGAFGDFPRSRERQRGRICLGRIGSGSVVEGKEEDKGLPEIPGEFPSGKVSGQKNGSEDGPGNTAALFCLMLHDRTEAGDGVCAGGPDIAQESFFSRLCRKDGTQSFPSPFGDTSEEGKGYRKEGMIPLGQSKLADGRESRGISPSAVLFFLLGKSDKVNLGAVGDGPPGDADRTLIGEFFCHFLSFLSGRRSGLGASSQGIGTAAE